MTNNDLSQRESSIKIYISLMGLLQKIISYKSFWKSAKLRKELLLFIVKLVLVEQVL